MGDRSFHHCKQHVGERKYQQANRAEFCELFGTQSNVPLFISKSRMSVPRSVRRLRRVEE